MKRNLWVVLFGMFLVVSSIGCRKKGVEAPRVETVNGITYVHNPATPLHPSKTVVFEEELTFREKDETGEIRLFKPGSFCVDANENVYIADDSDMAIKVYDRQGQYLKTIGRQGNGPGEFESIGNMLFLPDGRLLVTDYQQRRTSFFSLDGFYEARVWLDILPFLFASGKMYRMAEDEETGLRLLKRYRIIWQEAP